MRAAPRITAALGWAASKTAGMSENTSSSARRLPALARNASPSAITMTSGLSLCERNTSVEGSATGNRSNSRDACQAANRPAWTADSTHGNTRNFCSSATIRQDYLEIHSYAAANHRDSKLITNLKAGYLMLHCVHVMNFLSVDRQQQIAHQDSRGRGRRIGFHVQHQQSFAYTLSKLGTQAFGHRDGLHRGAKIGPGHVAPLENSVDDSIDGGGGYCNHRIARQRRAVDSQHLPVFIYQRAARLSHVKRVARTNEGH